MQIIFGENSAEATTSFRTMKKYGVIVMEAQTQKILWKLLQWREDQLKKPAPAFSLYIFSFLKILVFSLYITHKYIK